MKPLLMICDVMARSVAQRLHEIDDVWPERRRSVGARMGASSMGAVGWCGVKGLVVSSGGSLEDVLLVLSVEDWRERRKGSVGRRYVGKIEGGGSEGLRKSDMVGVRGLCCCV